jgi:hypothetical protein
VSTGARRGTASAILGGGAVPVSGGRSPGTMTNSPVGHSPDLLACIKASQEYRCQVSIQPAPDRGGRRSDAVSNFGFAWRSCL